MSFRTEQSFDTNNNFDNFYLTFQISTLKSAKNFPKESIFGPDTEYFNYIFISLQIQPFSSSSDVLKKILVTT